MPRVLASIAEEKGLSNNNRILFLAMQMLLTAVKCLDVIWMTSLKLSVIEKERWTSSIVKIWIEKKLEQETSDVKRIWNEN